MFQISQCSRTLSGCTVYIPDYFLFYCCIKISLQWSPSPLNFLKKSIRVVQVSNFIISETETMVKIQFHPWNDIGKSRIQIVHVNTQITNSCNFGPIWFSMTSIGRILQSNNIVLVSLIKTFILHHLSFDVDSCASNASVCTICCCLPIHQMIHCPAALHICLNKFLFAIDLVYMCYGYW